MTKSPNKADNISNNLDYQAFGQSTALVPSSPTPVGGSYTKHRRAKPNSNMGTIDIWAYFDKTKSQYNFLNSSGNAVAIASPNKWNVYEKNQNTGGIMTEKKSCFDKILCAESENHMVNTLGKTVVDSLSTGGASFLFIGKNDKLFLLQLILRLLVDELGSRGTN
jgi:hypothetical protein